MPSTAGGGERVGRRHVGRCHGWPGGSPQRCWRRQAGVPRQSSRTALPVSEVPLPHLAHLKSGEGRRQGGAAVRPHAWLGSSWMHSAATAASCRSLHTWRDLQTVGRQAGGLAGQGCGPFVECRQGDALRDNAQPPNSVAVASSHKQQCRRSATGALATPALRRPLALETWPGVLRDKADAGMTYSLGVAALHCLQVQSAAGPGAQRARRSTSWPTQPSGPAACPAAAAPQRDPRRAHLGCTPRSRGCQTAWRTSAARCRWLGCTAGGRAGGRAGGLGATQPAAGGRGCPGGGMHACTLLSRPPQTPSGAAARPRACLVGVGIPQVKPCSAHVGRDAHG